MKNAFHKPRIRRIEKHRTAELIRSGSQKSLELDGVRESVVLECDVGEAFVLTQFDEHDLYVRNFAPDVADFAGVVIGPPMVDRHARSGGVSTRAYRHELVAQTMRQ